ncbi:protocadherin gamma-A9-like [Hippocampus comes]|uniref:protocadherin gamma-A9-like n=1 Tax=Hippocampus comes TaxID=109280 RepID=UPI00094EB245|nr:PREDICTED: protocadherin gamma-A9-like [Hippocampus comes]
MDCVWMRAVRGRWRTLLVILCLCELHSASGQARYSIPEEQAEGSFVGNIARDLGLDLGRLVAGKARIITNEDRQYVDLKRDKGTLVVKERIDREQLCGKTTPCSFSFDIILENPIHLYRVTVEVEDINDNSPSFPQSEINLKIAESVTTGTRFSLANAADPDVGINDVQKYALKPSDNFKLEIKNEPNDRKVLEMILEKPLDREREESLTLMLIASDGGEPHRSGTVRIHISVLDANDNAPVCTQSVYKVDVPENSPTGTLITAVSAKDADAGLNGDVTYSIPHFTKEEEQLFNVNMKTGEIKIGGKLDFEKSKSYELNVQASDHGGYTDTCQVFINIIDENDNVPTIKVMSFSQSIPEDSSPGTTVAVFNVKDEDSEGNGVVKCSINDDVPFKIESSLTGYYTILTENFLDRENVPEYNVTITVSDQGSPPLSSSKNINVKISDVNDNPPKFHLLEYSKTVPENNAPGFSVFTVSASDADWGQNARVSYFLEEKDVNGVAVSSFVSINSENGVIHAVKSFDFEQIKSFDINITARDSGSPPLSSVATVRILIQDQNDNAPQEYNDQLTFYLVLALAVVSFLFITCLLLIISVKVYRWRQSRVLYHSNLPVIPYYPPRYSDTLGTGTLPHVYNYEVCRTTDSRKSDMKNMQAMSQSLVSVDGVDADTLHVNKKLSGNCSQMSTLSFLDQFTFLEYFYFHMESKDIHQCRGGTWRRKACLFVFWVFFLNGTQAQIRYSIPEEMKKGSLVGNVAQDLGLDLKRLRSGRARIVTGDNVQYAELRADKGLLVVHERIDREQLCGDVTPCSFTFEILLENPMELHPVTIEVLDVNDNAPTFENRHLEFEISELAALGSRFVLENAHDADVDANGLQSYILTPSDNFVLKQHVSPGGRKYAEMVLQKALDREEQPRLSLKLLALDGGNPQRSGTVNIEIIILDINDNAPVFNQSIYKVKLFENAPKNTHVLTVNATDADSGSNGIVTYSFSKSNAGITDLFHLDEVAGCISVSKRIDYENDKIIEFMVEAKDQGGLSESAKVEIEVMDLNDNVPVINVMSFTSPVSEDSPVGSTIGIINLKDLDAGENGHVRCAIEGRVPFKIKSNVRNYFALITDADLDRERVSEYDITVIASDAGSPPLSIKQTFNLKVSDVNDNAPVFPVSIYSANVAENNSPGVSVLSVSAKDPDENQNARVSYMLEQSEIGGRSISEFVSVNAESGVISAARSYDYEQMKELSFTVRAQDGGSPPLSSNVSVRILIQDQNDNAPQVLYPVQTGGSLLAEMVPRSADVGYLVTKVVAVDGDSGQNSWLSYKVHKATDRALFEVGLHNGEIRTVRQVTDKDAVKQRLTVVVEDNGRPSRSATDIVNVAVADSFPQVLSEFTDLSMHDKEYNDQLTFYLVLALAVVSFLFITCLLLIISVKVYRWRQSRVLYHSNLPVIPYYPPRYADTLGTGTLPHVYNYEVCSTTDSRKSDMKNMQGMSQSLVSVDGADANTLHVNKELSGNCSQMSTLVSELSYFVTRLFDYSFQELNKNGIIIFC